MRRTLYIDGEPRTVEAGRERGGWQEFFVYGHDADGRECPVASHSVPPWFWHNGEGASVRTGGHVYSWRTPKEG